MKKFIRGFSAFLAAGTFALLSLALVLQAKFPDVFQAAKGEEFILRTGLPLSAVRYTGEVLPISNPGQGEFYSMELRLFDRVPLKNIQVQSVPRKMVIPGGTPFGIKMFTKGVMVVGMTDIQIGSFGKNPAREAGIKVGDVLLSIGGIALNSNDDVKKIVSQSRGEALIVVLQRGDSTFEISLVPVKTEYDNEYKAGIWVRDSSAGIGTMTFMDPANMTFAGLGHAVCDVDTGKLMPLSSGEIVAVNITGVTAGLSGKPGELKGGFLDTRPIGRLEINSEVGIFGTLNTPFLQADPVPMAYKQEITAGPATIRATISGSQPQEFDIVIERINILDANSTKNMVIKVVDPDLLSTTGGIIQGMSGSPILQNGKLAGAVTHVFVNDPTHGYAVFAENMNSYLEFVESKRNAA